MLSKLRAAIGLLCRRRRPECQASINSFARRGSAKAGLGESTQRAGPSDGWLSAAFAQQCPSSWPAPRTPPIFADKAARADLIASDGRQMPIPQFCVTRRLPNSSNGCAARPQDRGGGAMRRRAVIVIPILLALAGYAHNLASCNNACAVALLAMSAMACVCPMIDPGSRQPVRMCGAGRDQLPGIMPACFGQMRV